jgi:phosphoribosyl-ATP pyrophosphohydrolase
MWVKGETSGQTQELLRIELDCDADALRFTVSQAGGGFCHLGTRTCWGAANGIGALAARIDATAEAMRHGREARGSYTARLLGDPALLAAKLREEAGELIDSTTPEHASREAADLLYFALVALQSRGGRLEDVACELDRRALKVTRRAGDAKPDAITPTTTCQAKERGR